MKKIYILLLITFISLLTVNCETDNIEPLGIQEVVLQQDGVKDIFIYTADDLPDIQLMVTSTAGKNLTDLASKDITASYYVESKNIIGITDSIGNKIFSYHLNIVGKPVSNFYNIIAIKPADGTKMAPFVIEYKLNEDGTKTAQKYFKLKAFLNSLEDTSTGKISADCGEFSTSASGSSGGNSSNSGSSSGSNNEGSSSSYTPYGSYTAPSYGHTSTTVYTSTSGNERTGVDVGWGNFCDCFDLARQKSAKGDYDELCPTNEWLLPINNDIVDVPPSCKSFKFTKVGNSQFSYVKGIRFLVIDSDGGKHYLNYDNPMEFSTPYADRFNVVYESGAIAGSSARALREAMDKAKDYILDNPWIGEYRAKRFFEEELARQYPLFIPGGRVQIRPNKQHVSLVTDYQATWFFDDTCDD